MKLNEISQTATAYIESLQSLKKSVQTVQTYTTALKHFIDYIEQHHEQQTKIISPVIINSYRTDLYNKSSVSVNTIRHNLIILHGFFEWCIRMGLLEQNPVNNADIPKSERIEYDLLSLEEIEMLLNSDPKRKNQNSKRNKAIITLLILTGIRNSELRYLKIENLDFENSIITVEHGKGDKFREVAFPDRVKYAVMEYLNSDENKINRTENDYLFTNENGTPLTRQGLTQTIKNHVRQVTGHNSIGAHDLRHAYASLSAHYQIPTRQISLSMGHSSEAITEQIYISILDKSAAADTVTTKFNEIFA